MIQDDLDKIEEKLKQSEAVKESNKTELLTLLTTLRKEIADLSQTHYEHAESIVGFAKLSAHEATRSEKNPRLLNLSIEGLASSVQGFEISHSRLVGIINTFCTMLSNLGI
jgi:putative cell wall-binding protein